MFDDLAVFQAEDVDPSEAAVIGTAPNQVVSYDEVALGYHPLNLHAHLGTLRDPLFRAFDKCRRALSCVGVVLDVL